MKYFFVVFALLAISVGANAQTTQSNAKYRTVTKDTINVKGVVYDYLGNPISNVSISASNSELNSAGFPEGILSTATGEFWINGVSPNDTLIFSYTSELTIINRGSRYLQVKMPEPKKIMRKDTLSVTAKRQIKKRPIPVFKIDLYYNQDRRLRENGDADFSYLGQGSFRDFIRSKVSYPQKAINNNIEGEVEVSFIIEKDGSVINPRIVRGIGYGCDDLVIDAVKHSPKWRPAIKNDHVAITESSVTVYFKLTDK